MAIVGFDQDPQGPPGAGLFHADTGESVYLHDPDLAAHVSSQTPDMRMALNDAGGGPGALSARDMAGGGQPVAPPSRADVAPPMDPQAPPPPGPAPAPGQPPPMLARPPEPAPGPQGPPVDPQQAALQSYVNAPVRSGPTRGGFSPKTAEVTTEGAKAPMSDQDWKEWGQAKRGIIDAHEAEARLTINRANQESAAAEAALPALVSERNAKQAAYDQQREAARGELAKAQEFTQMAAAKQIDPDRLYKKRGVGGNIMASIAQAMAGYGSPGMAHKMAMDELNADVAAQSDDIKSGQAGANNALSMIMKKYDFTLPQAEASLKMANLAAQNAELQRWSGIKLSQDAAIANQEWLAANKAAILDESRKIYDESFGKQTRKESLAYAPGSSGGARAPTEKERQTRLTTIKMGQDVGAMPDTSREGRALDAKQKNNPGAAKAQDQLNTVDDALRNASELDKLYAKPGILSRAERGRMEYLQSVAPLEVHKALTGMSRFTDAEGERYKTAYGEKGETLDYTGKHRAALGALREDLARKKSALEKAIHSGGGLPEEGDGHPDIQDVE